MAEQAGFGAMLTFDKGIPNQQTMHGRRLAVIVLKPDGQGIRALRALVGNILTALPLIQPGEVRIITNREAHKT